MEKRSLTGLVAMAVAAVVVIAAADPLYNAITNLANAGNTVLTGEAQGFGGTVTAEVTVNESGKIVAVSLTGDGETPEVGGAALPTLESAIVEAGGLDGVEAVSGASVTSGAVFEAVSAALGGDAGSAGEAADEGGAGSAAAADGGESAAPAGGEVLTGEAQGFGGPVTAEITVDAGGAITAITLTGDGETPALGGAALPVLEEAIAAAGGLDGVEAVSGASVTSGAVFEAVEAALGGAGASGAAAAGEVLTGEAEGFGGTVTAEVTVSDGRVTALKLSGGSETPALGQEALKTLTEAIVAAGGLDGVEAVSGATVTSNAVFEAVAAALGVEAPKAAVSEAGAAAAVPAAGTYTGEAQGFGGPVTAEVTVDENGAVMAITLTGDGETPSLGGAALPVLEEAIVAAGGIDGVDAVSGASMTSNAVFEAVEAALAGAPAAESGTEEAEAEAADEEAAEAGTEGPAAGTYTGEADGFGGTVTAEVTVDENGVITAIVLTGDGETPALGGAALPVLEEAILAAGGIDGVDAVSGASVTSAAVFEAVQAALGE